MGSLQLVDIDGDGKLDVLVSVPEAGAVVILWNQGTNAPAPFEFIPENTQPDKTLTVYPALASSTGAAPLYAGALDLDGDGAKDIVVYHAGVTPPVKKDPTGIPDIILSSSYESFGVLMGIPGKPRTFDESIQQRTWPGCDFNLGGGNCRTLPDGMFAEHLFDHRLGWQSGDCQGDSAHNYNNCLFFAPSDVVRPDTYTFDVATHSYSYTPATINSDASTRIRVVTSGLPTRNGQGVVDSFWFEGEGTTNQFAYDTLEKMIVRHDKVSATAGRQRSASSDIGYLSDGRQVLFTSGGFKRCVGPHADICHTDSLPDYLNHQYQVGSFLRWSEAGDGANGGPLIFSLADYYRFWEPGAKQYWWPHENMDGSHASVDSSASLLMWEFAEEQGKPDGTVEFKPYLQLDQDTRRFGALSLNMSTSYAVKPQLAGGHLGSNTEQSVVVLNYDPFAVPSSKIAKARLELYRPDDGSYVPVQPHPEGIIVGKYLKDGFPASISNTLPAGEKSGVLVGTKLGESDPARYALVKDKTTKAIKGLFAVGASETVQGIMKDGVVIPGLAGLAIGHYTLEIHNAKSFAEIDLNISNPFGIAASDYDWMAGQTCALLPDTKTGDLWPRQIRVEVTDFPGADKLQKVRWIKSDGTVKELPAAGYASYDAATSTVTLTVPTDLTDGLWTYYLEADNQWQKSPRSWNVTRDVSTLAQCSQRTPIINEEAYAQCDNTNLYLDSINYKMWPNRVGPGALRFFGSGFAQAKIKSAAIKQGDTRVFSTSLTVVDDNYIQVFFNDDDLKSKLVPGTYTDLYLYPETGDVVQANGVPATSSKINWRLPHSGTCPTPPAPEFTNIVNLGKGSGPGGQFQSGDWIEVETKNAWYPIPTSVVFLFKTKDGSLYALNNPRLPDELYTTHFDNTHGRLLFQVPENLDPYKLSSTSATDGPETGASSSDKTDNPVVPVAIEIAGAGAGTLAVYEAYTTGSLVAYGLGGASLGTLAVYGTNWALTQISSKITAMTVHNPGATGVDKPGNSADEQPNDPEELEAFGVITQAQGMRDMGPVDFVVVKGKTYLGAYAKAKIAVPLFVKANYLGIGGVTTLDTNPIPLGTVATTFQSSRSTNVPWGTTNPIGLTFNYRSVKCELFTYYGGLSLYSTIEADAPTSDFTGNVIRNSVLWRRQELLHNYPPSPIFGDYSETLGNCPMFGQSTDLTYTTDARNDYTAL